MSIDFFIGEVGIQNQSIKSYCNEVISGMDQVRTALSQFVIEPSLKGGAYDSSKSYFNSAYIPATKGFTLVCEAMIKANDRFSKDYKSNVDSNSLQEDVLVSYISRLNSLSTALEELPAGNIFLSSVIENLQNVRQKTDEKLDKLREYNYTSVHIFDELESQLQNLEAGVMMLVEGKAWNQSTGTFSTMGLNLDWATDINQSWDARDKKKKGFDDEKNKQLEKYDIIRCYDPITKKTTWALEKDGKAIIDPAITKYLNKVGDSLNKSDYSMIEVTPKEWEKRVNDAWKMNGTEYFSGKQYGWSMAGLAHVQDAKGKLDDSGAWDALWSLGFMYGAVKSINNMSSNNSSIKNESFGKLMSPEESLRYDNYWGRKAPQVGVPNSSYFHYREYNGKIEVSKVIFDSSGRQTIRVDFSNHGMPADHSIPHIHEYLYGPGLSPEKGLEFRYNY